MVPPGGATQARLSMRIVGSVANRYGFTGGTTSPS